MISQCLNQWCVRRYETTNILENSPPFAEYFRVCISRRHCYKIRKNVDIAKINQLFVAYAYLFTNCFFKAFRQKRKTRETVKR